jgi:hypothetical protein
MNKYIILPQTLFVNKPFSQVPAQKQQFAFPANLSTFGFWELFRRSNFLNFSMKLACGLSCSRFDFYPGDIF